MCFGCRLFSPVKAFSIGYLIEAVPGIFKSLFQPSKFTTAYSYI